MTAFFMPHKFKLATLLVLCNLGLLLHLLLGEVKPSSNWDWLDVVGEGGSAILILLWIGLLLKSRPAGLVTNLLFAGLGCLFFSLWLDTLDEFIAQSPTARWDGWLESGPMPVGFILLTLGIYHWHREQLAITAQMRNRERVYREHRQFDDLTPLGDADYLRSQLQLALDQAQELRQPLSLVMLDLDEFSSVNRYHGQAEGDRVLQVLTQQILLNLRSHDLLCRLAGDRFVVVLPNTSEIQAREIARELAASVSTLAYKTIHQGERLHLQASTVAVMARQENPQDILQQLTLAMARAKPKVTTRLAS